MGRTPRRKSWEGRPTSSVASDQESDILQEDDLVVGDDVEGKWWQSIGRHRAMLWIPILVSALLTVAGIVLVVFYRGRYALYFDAWRWCFFVAAFVPIYWLSRLFLHLLLLMVEAKLFTNAKVLFFLLSVRISLGRFLRSVLWIPVFAALFGPASNRAEGVRTVYFTILRLLGCFALFWLANVIKTLIARSISSHFHQGAHFAKMRSALEQEAILAALSQPRQQHRVDDQLLEQAKTGQPGELDQLSPQKLASLRADREASRRIAPLAIISNALQGTQTMMRRASAPVLSGMQRAATSPDELPSPEDVQEFAEATRNPENNSHNKPRFVSRAVDRVSEEGDQLSASEPNMSSTPTLNSMEHGELKPRKGLMRPLNRLRQRRHTSSIRSTRSTTDKSKTSRAEHKAQQLKEQQLKEHKQGELKHKVSLPGGAASELEVVMKLHTIERHIRKNKLKVTLTDEIGAATKSGDQELNSSAQARRLAFYLFWNVKADYTRNYIQQADLEHFMPASKAAKAFAMFDQDGDGKVTLHNARDAVIRVYKERKDLAHTLKDTKGVVKRLEFLIAVVVHILFLFFYLLIFQVNVNKVWLTISSIILAFAFVFGNSIRNVFESVVFLFVVHPFDVGDALMVTDPSDPVPGAQYYTVEEIMLLNTKVKRWDGAIIYFPNIVLDSNPLVNLSRSSNKWESFKLWCDIGTPAISFDVLRERIKVYLDAEAEFSGEFTAIVLAAGDPMKIQLGIFFEFSFNGADLGRTWKARHGFYALLCAALTELKIGYTMPTFVGSAGDHSQAHVPLQEEAVASGGRSMIGAATAARPYSFY